MQRVALNRSNPTSRLASIAYAVARRQAASNAAMVPVLVGAAVEAVANDLGASIVTINDTLGTLNTRVTDLEQQLEN